MKKVKEQALQLPKQERARLVEDLIRSLDDEEDPEAERLWIEVAEQRYNQYKDGNVTGKPSEDVLKEIRSKLG